eukprot:scaffold12592_cov120-Isochrysis_galbana.AAC.3
MKSLLEWHSPAFIQMAQSRVSSAHRGAPPPVALSTASPTAAKPGHMRQDKRQFSLMKPRLASHSPATTHPGQSALASKQSAVGCDFGVAAPAAQSPHDRAHSRAMKSRLRVHSPDWCQASQVESASTQAGAMVKVALSLSTRKMAKLEFSEIVLPLRVRSSACRAAGGGGAEGENSK